MTNTLNPPPKESQDARDLSRYLDPLVQSWLGVSGKGVALTQTQVNDPTKYAGDFENLDTTGTPTRKSLRAVAGAHSLLVNGDGISLSGLAITGNLTVGGNLTVTGTLGVTGAATFTATIAVSQGATLSSTLVVGGNVTFNSNASIAGTLGVTGVSTLAITNTGALTCTTLTASGAAALQSTLVVTSTSTFGGNVTMNSNATVAGTLGVTGVSTLGIVNAGATSVTTLTASSTLNVTGTSTLGTVNAGSLTATSLTLGSGDIISMGDLTMSGDIDHNGTNIGFYSIAPVARQTVTGSRGGNAALLDLLTKLENLGLIINSTS